MTMDLISADRVLRDLIAVHAVAISFVDTPPLGVPRLLRTGPATCAYFHLAAQGAAFFTVESDHAGCVVGSYCHGAAMSLSQVGDLAHRIAEQPRLSYLREASPVPANRRHPPLRCVVYAPLHSAPCDPDVVLVLGTPDALMSLAEAAEAAGCGEETSSIGRPICALFPKVLATGRAALSLGCAGGRALACFAASEACLALPGGALEAVLGFLPAILAAHAAQRDALAHPQGV